MYRYFIPMEITLLVFFFSLELIEHMSCKDIMKLKDVESCKD